jgi:alpha-D-xyloside xylohydrolase
VVKSAKKEFDKTLFHSKLSLEFNQNEAVYGLGQHQEGTLNLRGTRKYVHQANMKIAFPMVVSTAGYGILMDTYSPLIFNDNEYGSYLYSESVEEMDYYFIYGSDFDQIVSGYRRLSGQAVMLPKWVFGYMQSQERYETQKEIIDVASQYRNLGIPLDCIVLDWMSWEGDLWGQKTFDTTRFPNPSKMMDVLHEQGIRLMIALHPRIREGSDNRREMEEKNLMFPYSELYNAFDENARSMFWEHAKNGLFVHDIDAWWCDSSEGHCPEWSKLDKMEPDELYREFQDAAKTQFEDTHTNAYGLVHSMGIYDGQRKETEKKRVVNLTRSGGIGQQKYGVILWSGDISATWETMKKQIAAGLNLCVCGIPYWTIDIGGFFVKSGKQWFWNGDYEDGCNDLGYRELYTRWFQFGAFLPVFRSHGTDTRREVWKFGEEGTPFYDTLVRFIQLRYTLLPYIYSMSAMVTFDDYTMMRLLAFEFCNDPAVYDIKDQYMFGPALMVCPVTKPMYYDKNSKPLKGIDKTRSVYLPADTKWYDFWTETCYNGGQTMVAQAPIEIMPLYVKAGSILPTTEVVQHSGASSNSHISLTIYPGCDGSFKLYQDDNDGYCYENGEHAMVTLSWSDAKRQLIIAPRKGFFENMPETITFKVKVVGKIETVDVTYEGKEVISKL